ncbi:MAG: VWA domain-containing protein, partial [Elusimicrobiales bacterium]|nr:VWA domain-containing protein [Elusimicrobiales bacterium]
QQATKQVVDIVLLVDTSGSMGADDYKPNRLEAAKEAGYRPAAVLDGFGDAHLILRSNPEIMEKDFSDPKPWLLWLGLERDPKGVSRGTYICPDSPIEHAHYGRTGMDLRDIETGIRKLREAKRKVVGGGK